MAFRLCNLRYDIHSHGDPPNRPAYLFREKTESELSSKSPWRGFRYLYSVLFYLIKMLAADLTKWVTKWVLQQGR